MLNPSPSSHHYIKYNWPSLLWAAFILVMCLMPGSDLPSVAFPHVDKVVHFGLYFILAGLLFWGWTRQQQFPWLHLHPVLKIVTITALYGLLIELLQGTVTTDRDFDLLDALTNTAGALAACAISVKLFSKRILFP